jgi:hypothetical protein
MSAEFDWSKVKLRLVDGDQPSPQAKKRQGRFVMVPLEWAGQVAVAGPREPRTFIWLQLLYLSWKTGSKTVTLSNVELRRRKIDRHTKYRALRALQQAGLLRIEPQRGGASIQVTLLH